VSAWPIHVRGLILAAWLLTALATVVSFERPTPAAAQEGWVIRSFEARYVVAEDGRVAVTEDILVDFGTLERHGIFRDIPVEYAYDGEQNRLISLTGIWVDDAMAPVPFETSREGSAFRIKIGDPDVLVTGEQRYRISYTINDGLNPFPNHDELYWNVTGADWPVIIEGASSSVELPGPGLQAVDCFQGPTGSTEPCTLSADATGATFQAQGALNPGSELTFVVAIEKGLVDVGPPVLVDAERDFWERTTDFLGLHPANIAIAAVIFCGLLAVLGRQWWAVGRDRWFGNTYYFTDEPPTDEIRPMFSHETVVVEYEPPSDASGRRLRPAEVGILLDERADILDVSASIVDLAVRGYLKIEELGGDEYQLVRLEGTGGVELLPYEEKLYNALFDEGDTVKLDDLKNDFYRDLAKVKTALYKEGVKEKFFPTDPEKARSRYSTIGITVAVAGGVAAWFLGQGPGLGLIGVAIAAAGGLMALTSGAMPRRTARGRQAYRRALGFRMFVTAGDHGEYRFAEEQHIFEEYLPYAIVFKSAKKWAEQFEALAIEPQTYGWYVGSRPFQAVAFAEGVHDFSSSIGSTLASTPGGSGGSGFSGGGSSGGGGGGGGGGSW